ncbi:hypothetical protein OMAG_000920 [Candidatus Omnitrophus magneticus]|uniref:Glycoside hydrolase family 5 domain-containing protein n=1 Tax=Candidatus Omnitrophus magneticus TaxID=1609969 RepID=A0A0F0CPG9_9BACT|nr:hypothetical protein OMAG_000920 [Candidatus Omnitrophus magneticus]
MRQGNKTFIFLLAGIFILAWISFKFFYHPQEKNILEFQKGMGYVAWAKDRYSAEESDASLEALAATGTKYVSIVVIWYQTTCWSGDIQRLDITASDESLRHAIKKAHQLGMKVMLKPHLDILDESEGGWRGEIGCVKEEDWSKWFEKYTDYILYYAKIAQEEKVELYCVGTELSTAAIVKPESWREIIKKVRGIYKGFVLYAAHWDSYMDVRFWDAVDFVGINAYFPLTESLFPTEDELRAGWSKWVTELEEFQAQIKKPIIFPECGCNSADGAATRPWEHLARREVNLELQQRFYKVLMEIFFEKQWFYGLYWWYWGTNPKMGGEFNRSFTPQNKPAANMLTEWYSKNIPRPAVFIAE